MQYTWLFADHHGLELLAQHDHVSLASLDTVEAVVEPVLAPDSPATATIPTQGQPLDVYRLVQQLKVIPPASGTYMLQGQFPHPDRPEEMQAQDSKGHQGDNFSQR